ncbi:hypothetical protein LY78DRAFT_382918 [Colletotrichum sublineola]|nr:hypothetical protein LY78DRAFT_382918 [Colletotrichum sublineola]
MRMTAKGGRDVKHEGSIHDTAGSTIGWSGRRACVCLGGSAIREKGGSLPVGQGQSQRGDKPRKMVAGMEKGGVGRGWEVKKRIGHAGAYPYQCSMLGLPGCVDCAVDILAVVCNERDGVVPPCCRDVRDGNMDNNDGRARRNGRQGIGRFSAKRGAGRPVDQGVTRELLASLIFFGC